MVKQKHAPECFEIATNEIYGRYLIAARDIKPGELILKERPVLVGPAVTSLPLCLQCFRPLSPFRKPHFCPKCGVAPLCAATCQGEHHSVEECRDFASNLYLTGDKLLQFHHNVLPLRCLLMRTTHPIKWQEFCMLEGHVEQRRHTPIWRTYQATVEPFLRQLGVLSDEDVKQEVVQKICGVLDVNSFEMRIPGFEATLGGVGGLGECVRGVFLTAALMAHDCIANTHLAVDDLFEMTVHASVPIEKGKPIFFNYTNTLQGTWDRQEHLQHGKYFKCSCKRCSDPTECGTYMSSIICVKCRRGFVSAPVEHDAPFSHMAYWRCSSAPACNYHCHGSLVKSALFCAQQLIEETDKTNLEAVETLIKKLSRSLAPTHALLLDLKQCVVGLLTEQVRAQPKPSRQLLCSKVDACRELIPVLSAVEPGISRLVGIALYEMHAPMVVLANREYDNNEINAEQFLMKLSQAEEALKKAIAYLIYEPVLSPEGRLGARAINELKLLRKNTASVQKIIAKQKKSIK